MQEMQEYLKALHFTLNQHALSHQAEFANFKADFDVMSFIRKNK